MGKAILFVRVSTQQQRNESQETILRNLAKKDGYKDSDIIVIGKKESAIRLSEEQREGIKELKWTIEHNDVDIVYIVELSRLSRRERDLIDLKDYFVREQVQLCCLNPEFLLLDENKEVPLNSELVFNIFTVFAKQEMIEKTERFKRGRRQKALEGKYNGGKIPFGYKIDKERDNLIVVDEKVAPLIEEIFDRFEGGLSQVKLTRRLRQEGYNVTLSQVNNILGDERYTGRKKIHPGSTFERSYPIIITEEQFDRCREISKANSTPRERYIYYAKRLIKCLDCGCYWSSSGSKTSYVCYDAHKKNRDLENYHTPQCTNNTCISINAMDSLLWYIAQEKEAEYILSDRDEDKKKKLEEKKEYQKKIDNVQKRIYDLNEKEDRANELYIERRISKKKLDEKTQKYEEEKREIYKEKKEWEQHIKNIDNIISQLEERFKFDSVNETYTTLDNLLKLQEALSYIDNDEERVKIISRHVKEVNIEKTSFYLNFKNTKNGKSYRETNGKKITVKYYNRPTEIYLYCPTRRIGGTFFRSNEKCEVLEELYVDYLPRYIDFAKRKRHKREKEEKQEEKAKKYPMSDYILGLYDMCGFLGVSISSLTRYLKQGYFKEATIKDFGMDIFNKNKCCKILKESNNPVLQRIWKNMNNKEK